MTRRVDELFEAVREVCDAGDWSRGVELSRAHKVVFDRFDDDRAVFRIAISGGRASRTLSLFPDDVDWDCGCTSAGSTCAHVAAAVILWKRAVEQGHELASAPPSGRVGYRFERTPAGLALGRVIMFGEHTHTLEVSLAALTSGRVAGPSIVPSQADLTVELALGTHRRGLLPKAVVTKLFGRLAHCPDVRLDGEAVRVSAEPVTPVVRVDDQDGGFRLHLVDDESVSERFDNGIARCGATLRPTGEPRLTGRELHELAGGRHYPVQAVAELVGDVLPALRSRIRVDVRTRRLPDTVREAPRVRIETTREGQGLSVLATLVYGDPPRARIDGGRLVHLDGAVPLRDEAHERRLVRRLQRELELAPGVRADFEGEQAVAFTARLERWNGGGVIGSDHRHFRLAPSLVPRVRVSASDLHVSFVSEAAGGSAEGGGGRADPRRVLEAWRQGASLVPLVDGGWAPLPAEWLERHGHRIGDLLAAREQGGTLPTCMLPDLARLCDELDRPAPPELGALRRLTEGFAGIPAATLPSDLRATLRAYQRRGIDWLVFLREAGLGGLLADDMGLGKTLQAICAIRGRTLVVAPTSVLHNWADEIRRFRPALRCAVYHGAGRRLDPAAQVTLTTYALLRLDADTLVEQSWDTVALDEAQAIKNPESQVAGAAYRLQAGFRLALTGTPVENRLDELWSQFHFINRGLLGGRGDFHERYAAPILAGEAGAAARLRERIRPFLLRRLKREVAPELPPRTEVVLRCELAEDERAVYDAIRAATRSEVVARLARGENVLAALEALLRLRQAACHRGLVPGEHAARSAKVELLLETLESILAEGHKALVFSQWTSLLDRVEPALREASVPFTRLDGSTRDRAGVVRTFQDDAGPPVMLISLKAGGTGLNLTAADHIFLLDPWWNPAVEDQAADRVHRIGQDKPVMIYRLVAEQTVEERILELQSRKREVADAALGQADRAASITREELLELLR